MVNGWPKNIAIHNIWYHTLRAAKFVGMQSVDIKSFFPPFLVTISLRLKEMSVLSERENIFHFLEKTIFPHLEYCFICCVTFSVSRLNGKATTFYSISLLFKITLGGKRKR